MSETYTVPASKDGGAIDNGGSSLGQGRDDHLVIGIYGGYLHRAYIDFSTFVQSLRDRNATQVVAVKLKAKTTSAHVVLGTGTVQPRLITETWDAGTRGADESWYNDNALEWSNKPGSTITGGQGTVDFPGSAGVAFERTITALMRSRIPADILDDEGNPGGGSTFRGIELRNSNEGSSSAVTEISSSNGSYSPALEVTIETSVAPAIPTDLDPPDGGVDDSEDGVYLTLAGNHADPFGRAIEDARNELYFPTATDAGVADGTDVLAQDPEAAGAIINIGLGTFRTEYEVPRRSSWKTRARTQNEDLLWGPWSPLRSVSVAAKPIAVNVSVERGTRTPLFGVSISDPDSVLGGIIGTISAVEIDAWTNVGGGGRVYLWTSGKQSVGGNPTRATLLYGSGGATLRNPEWSESVGYRVRLWNDADVVSDYTADSTFVPTELTGPAIMSPNDRATKINTQLPAWTIGDVNPFDQISYRTFATEDQAAPSYDSGAVAVGNTTVRASSASGQPILQVNSIAGILAGDVLRVNDLNTYTVLSTNAVGPTVTMTGNLAATHTSPQTVKTMQVTRTHAGAALQWGSSPWWDAAVRTVGDPSLGIRSAKVNVQLNTLPTAPTISPVTTGSVYRSSDGVWIVPGTNPLLRIPFEDVDEGAYGETPARKTITIKVAAATKGTGALVETRATTSSGLGMIPEDEHVGERISALDSATGWTASVGSVTVAATNPTGYGGSSVQWTPGSVGNGSSVFLYRALSAAEGSRLRSNYSGGALLRLHARLSVLIASQALRLKIEKVGSWAVTYALGTLTAGYVELSQAKQTTSGTTGTPWSTDPDRINLELNNGSGGAASPVVLVRDLRIGTVQTAKTVPDGHLVLESSYDVQAQYGDAAAPGAMGALSSWQTIKAGTVPVITTVSPKTLAMADFAATTVDSWSTPELGGAWTLAGTAADFDQTGGKGTISSAVSTGHDARQAGVSAADVDVTVDLESDKIPTTNETHVQIRGRHNGTTTYYRLMLYITAGGVAPALSLSRVIAGVGSTTGIAGTTATAIPDWSANVQRRFRLQIAGTGSAVRIRAKVWLASVVEPAAWQIDATDTDAARIVAAGQIQLSTWVGAIGNAPLVWKVDRYRVVPVLQDPTPLVDWSQVLGGAKTATAFLARAYARAEIIGGSSFDDALLATVAGTTATDATLPAATLADGRRYAWEAAVTDSDMLSGTSAREAFATLFDKPAAPTLLVLTPAASPPSVALSWTASTAPYLAGYIVSRREAGGEYVRINALGDPDPSAVITATEMIDYRAANGVALDYSVRAWSGAADDATGLSDSLEGSTSTAVEAWWYVDPAGVYTEELRYVVDWSEEAPLSEYVADPLPDEDGEPEPAILITGERQGERVRLVLELAPDDAYLLEVIRSSSVARDHAFGYLKSPLGDVWAGRFRAAGQAKTAGPGRRRVETSFLVLA
jgi:hypothetical protein